jgi:lipopolysaccharide biosynthesis glycosyltransferase
MKSRSTISRFLLVYQPNYWQGFACTVASISKRFEYNVKIDVITEKSHVNHFEKIKNKYLSPNLNNLQFECQAMKDEDLILLKSFSFQAHFVPSICFRIFYLDLFQPNEPVCYLDTDIIFLTSGSDLADFIFEDFPISARRVFFKEGPPYFNSGVIVMNCRGKRDELNRLLNEAKKLLPALSTTSTYLDQDALNTAFENKWGELPSRLNRTPSDSGVPLERCIAHATGSRKPWMLGAGHDYTQLYEAEIKSLRIPFLKRYHLFWQIRAFRRRVDSLIRAMVL